MLLPLPDPPKFFTHPRAQTINETDTLVLTCELEGKPLANVAWQNDGVRLDPSKDNRLDITQPTRVNGSESRLTITRVNRTDQGNYTCRANNSVDTVMSSTSRVTVQCEYSNSRNCVFFVKYSINIPSGPKRIYLLCQPC